ncbi:hypothetical protein DICPUDRAFT_83098 [Dictyostelium purpureum]|uniref:Uncharacterized protein n=1 Tax=Dictyostelium purpureum TaxID=5786 RepID=F0ZYI9_DICPU|nr:uncharacterized protein DICPUDRAFT_83098 [Dictyostelium purpureum]EGC30987.1 hypothetical protein DICPUDRAFT_83098 [Dictyostelium purpureum]|eukprot:XP_003292488.1 hypothetical protein DICPUDRAFT_83098 [Dictyostelium purpureum]
MDPVETNTANEQIVSPLKQSSANVEGGECVTNKSELFRSKLESPNCLFCNEKLLGAYVYQHYITCTKVFLKELQSTFIPSSILSYCIDKELLESVYTPVYVQQLQALINQMNAHLQTIQNPVAAAPATPASPAPSKNDKKKK